MVSSSGGSMKTADLKWYFSPGFNHVQKSSAAVIEIDATTDVSFILVDRGAKDESPLHEIKDTATQLVVKATVTFYGHDLANNPVQGSGDMTISFADWINE